MTFKPMLSAKAPDVSALQFPLLASPKLDGIRCCIVDGVPLSRNLKPIQNQFIREALSGLPPLDGELVVGPPTGNDVWNRSNSGVMSRDGEPDFTFWVFDFFGEGFTSNGGNTAFSRRLEAALIFISKADAAGCAKGLRFVDHNRIADAAALNEYEAKCVTDGYEGVMLRNPHGPYKFGRSTAREGWLMKLKRFEDHEALVTGVVEQMHNGNAATRDELGRVKRSTHAAGKTGKGTLGRCNALMAGTRSSLGRGLTTGRVQHCGRARPSGRWSRSNARASRPMASPGFRSSRGCGTRMISKP